jgi:hypothetical protein
MIYSLATELTTEVALMERNGLTARIAIKRLSYVAGDWVENKGGANDTGSS